MPDKKNSRHSIQRATQSRAKFSGHGKSKGAAGVKEISYHPENSQFLKTPGESYYLSPNKDKFNAIQIHLSWDNKKTPEKKGFLNKFLNKNKKKKGIDLDLGCFYEMQDGTRGVLQAFGEKFGNYDSHPYMSLTGDERTGEKHGHDESIHINPKYWSDIKRVLIYIYIYDGICTWKKVKPEIFIDIPGEEDLVVQLAHYNDDLDICAVGSIENIDEGIKLTNHTEYFPGQQEMDYAFGFGLSWTDGKKA